jgi:hypothetical protein
MKLCFKHSERGARMVALVALAIGTSAAGQAAAVTYDINFTVGFDDVAAPTGSFTYNAATSQLTNFTVNWDGVTFDLTSAANGVIFFPEGPACVGNLSGGAAAFALLSPGCPTFWAASAEPEDNTVFAVFAFGESDTELFGSSEVNAPNAIDGDTGADGGFTIAAVQAPSSSATPEPGTVALVAGGLGLVLLRRGKRGGPKK